MRIRTNGIIAIGVAAMMAVMVAAIVTQEFSWWVVPFSLLFLTIFTGILWACFADHRENRFRRASQSEFPDEPWMWDKRWQSDVMESRSTSQFWGSLGFTLILTIFALFGVVSLGTGLPDGNYWVLLNLVPIAGAAYFARKTYLAWRTWRLERLVTLTSETRPAWVGAEFSTVMKVSGKRHETQVEAWLEHMKVLRREDRDGVLYEDVLDRKLTGRSEQMSNGQIRVSVNIPENSPTTSWGDERHDHWWDLVVVAVLSGKEITLRYEVPVADPAKHALSGA